MFFQFSFSELSSLFEALFFGRKGHFFSGCLGPSAGHCVPMGRSGTGAFPPSMNSVFDAARMCKQLQRSFTLCGADAITDHGAEKVATAEKTTVELFSRPLPLCLIIFFFQSVPQKATCLTSCLPDYERCPRAHPPSTGSSLEISPRRRFRGGSPHQASLSSAAFGGALLTNSDHSVV